MKNKPWIVSFKRSPKDGRYYPHIKAGNGEITWAAPRGYLHPSAAHRAVNRFIEQMKGSGFVSGGPVPT